MKFSQEKNRVAEEEKKLIVGSPERGIIVPWDITPSELRQKFSNFRQPSIAVFEEALAVARATGRTATITVDYTDKGHSHMPKVSENVHQNVHQANEFWI